MHVGPCFDRIAISLTTGRAGARRTAAASNLGFGIRARAGDLSRAVEMASHLATINHPGQVPGGLRPSKWTPILPSFSKANTSAQYVR
jgi:hypothetical protein